MPLYLFEWQAFLPAPVRSITFVFRGTGRPLALAQPWVISTIDFECQKRTVKFPYRKDAKSASADYADRSIMWSHLRGCARVIDKRWLPRISSSA